MTRPSTPSVPFHTSPMLPVAMRSSNRYRLPRRNPADSTAGPYLIGWRSHSTRTSLNSTDAPPLAGGQRWHPITSRRVGDELGQPPLPGLRALGADHPVRGRPPVVRGLPGEPLPRLRVGPEPRDLLRTERPILLVRVGRRLVDFSELEGRHPGRRHEPAPGQLGDLGNVDRAPH